MFKQLRKLIRGEKPRRPHGPPPYVPDPRYWCIVSFPKSGNTWMRFLLAHVLFPEAEAVTFQSLGSMVPDACSAHDRERMADPAIPFARCAHPFVKSHDPYSPAYRRVLYVVRDGRDALASYFHWLNARRPEPLALDAIVRGEGQHGSWSEHVLGWLRGDADAKVVVKYEDLLADTAGELRRVLAATGVTAADDAVVERAVRLSSFDNMRKVEREHGLFDGGKAMTAAMPFVRKGRAGDWRTLFSEADQALFWQLHGEAMREAGYAAE